jgi:hypothetical protein
MSKKVVKKKPWQPKPAITPKHRNFGSFKIIILPTLVGLLIFKVALWFMDPIATGKITAIVASVWTVIGFFMFFDWSNNPGPKTKECVGINAMANGAIIAFTIGIIQFPLIFIKDGGMLILCGTAVTLFILLSSFGNSIRENVKEVKELIGHTALFILFYLIQGSLFFLGIKMILKFHG